MLCFRKILVAKKLIDKRGVVSVFTRQKIFVSQCRKFIVGESFSVSFNSNTEKVY